MKRFFGLLTLIFTLIMTSAYAAKYHLIWQIDTDAFYEVDWLREVLSEVDHDEECDGAYSIYKDNAIIVTCGDDERFCAPYFAKLLEKGYKFGVILISDEHNHAGMETYLPASFIFRHYWRKKYAAYKHVMPLPLGYGRGLWENSSEKHELKGRKAILPVLGA